jgi:hypothetical protein
MIHRRTFLALLASLMAVFGRARASHQANIKAGNPGHRPTLVLHKGWVLRSDDPRDS